VWAFRRDASACRGAGQEATRGISASAMGAYPETFLCRNLAPTFGLARGSSTQLLARETGTTLFLPHLGLFGLTLAGVETPVTWCCWFHQDASQVYPCEVDRRPRGILNRLPRRRRNSNPAGANMGLLWNVARHSPSAMCESESR
jgi:hypothetical protein